jgi:hypothetical protein
MSSTRLILKCLGSPSLLRTRRFRSLKIDSRSQESHTSLFLTLKQENVSQFEDAKMFRISMLGHYGNQEERQNTFALKYLTTQSAQNGLTKREKGRLPMTRSFKKRKNSLLLESEKQRST